ncbi:MAG: hypothetical protein KUG78_06920 [Kangiellaceae bacterium]|nr:hypothetical protein [Kangiellaceae bacterium]
MYLRLVIMLSILLSFSLKGDDIPAELAEWKDWVKYQQEYRNCPQLNGSKTVAKTGYLCGWPSELKLAVGTAGLEFSQHWRVIEESKIPLPGDKSHWPQSVSVNKVSAVVLEENGRPYILLAKGDYQLNGSILWHKQPESFVIPEQVALVEMQVDGKSRAFIDRRGNRIWLGQTKPEQVKERDFLKVWVNRLIQDNHPMTMTVALELEVGGSGREQQLTQFDLGQYQLKSIHSELNARIDSLGNLLVQLKPGSYELQLEFKINQFPSQLTFSELGEHWPQQEIWVYKDNQRLRSTQVVKASPIDSGQGLKDQWRQLPHFVVNAGDTFEIVQRHRGISHGSDSLSLNREMWLSFDHSTYYFFDAIDGTKSKDWRVNTIRNYQLNQLSNHGEQRLITYDEQQRTGAEIRTPQLAIEASGEVAAENMHHASGWDIQFANTSIKLNIPPGRKVIAITGADNSSGDWINQWNLIDLFFILITLALVFKSFGLLPSIFALVTLVLSYHERNMPMFLWFNLAVALSLSAHISRAKLIKPLSLYKWASVGLLLLTLLPFLAEQIRFTLYPQLEIDKHISAQYSYDSFSGYSYNETADEAPPVEMKRQKVRSNKPKIGFTDEENNRITVTGSRVKRSELDSSYEQGAIIQAGKGKPDWQWQQVNYGWNGPVTGSEAVGIILMSENTVRLTRIFIILFSALWLISVLNKNSKLTGGLSKLLGKSSKASSSAVLIALCSGLALIPEARAADYPDPQLLKQLNQRLYPKAMCSPDCVTNSMTRLSINGEQLTLEMSLHSGDELATVLPHSSDWKIDQVSINDRIVRHLWRNKVGSWVLLNKGLNRLKLVATLKNKNDLMLRFVEKPKQFESNLNGWELTGVNNGHLQTDSIQLTKDAKTLQANRLVAQQKGQPVALEQSIKDLLLVTRRFSFGSQWRLDTLVERRAPLQATITAQLALYPFEQPITKSDQMVDRIMKISIPRNSQSYSWESSLSGESGLSAESSLSEHSEFELTALDDAGINESWQILVYPNWNIKIDGIPAVAPRDASGDDFWVYEYFPRANESIKFSISKPKSTEGKAVAITKVQQTHQVSKRKTTTHLNIDYKATRAESLQLKIAEAELKSVIHDGQTINLGAVEGIVSIGLKPGTHQLKLLLESTRPISFDSKTNEILLSQPFANLSTQVNLPGNRWLLSARGPGYGPAIVYWGELIFFLLLAFGLSRLSFSPLNYAQWLILGLGMSTYSWPALSGVAIWLLASEWKRHNQRIGNKFKISVSWLTLISTIMAVAALIFAIPHGLLESPNMGVMGNNSFGNTLNWFLDLGNDSLGLFTLYSLPLWAYKGLMLLWATWLSVSLIRWLGWIWNDLADAPFRKPRIMVTESKGSNKK